MVLACVAITMFAANESDDKIDDQNKRLDEYLKRIQLVEQQLNIRGDTEKPEVSEIKPLDAFQISVRDAKPADLALDGNDDTHMYTEKQANPWWCADMQDIYYIKRVIIININLNGEPQTRANYLRVGVTNTRPVVGENLALDAYTLCGYKPGLMGLVGIVNCPDDVSGQYLIVQFGTNNYMNIAEVKIYGYKIKDKL